MSKADATQEMVEKAAEKLNKAISELKEKEEIKKEELEAAIKKARELNENDYTPKSWKQLKEALAEAEKVMADENATQEMVEKAAEKLSKAVSELKEKSAVRKGLLKDTIEKAKELDGDSGIIDQSDTQDEEGDIPEESNTGEQDTDENGESGETPGVTSETAGGNKSGMNEDYDIFNGILKEINLNESTVTVENETEGELVLKISENSRIMEGDSAITFDELEKSVGNKVIAEYDEAKNVITLICLNV